MCIYHIYIIDTQKPIKYISVNHNTFFSEMKENLRKISKYLQILIKNNQDDLVKIKGKVKQQSYYSRHNFLP